MAGRPSRDPGECSTRPEVGQEKVKQCTHCHLWMLLDAFTIDTSAPSGRQSWCLDCKDVWEQVNGYKRFRNILKKEGLWWSYAEYIDVLTSPRLAKRGPYRCLHCRFDIRKTGGSHIDRVDNRIGHLLENCVPSCGICNFLRGAKSIDVYGAFLQTIADGRYMDETAYRDGIPWDRMDLNKFGIPKHLQKFISLNDSPKTKKYRVPPPGQQRLPWL